MKIAVIGAGAIGLYYGAMLQRAGHDVRFLLRRDFEAIAGEGLTITSPNGDFHLAALQGFRNSKEMGAVDLVLVGLKTFANKEMVEMVRPLMKDETAVLTLQNGLGNEELLAEAFGSGNVLGGVAIIGVNRGKPGTVHHLAQGGIRLGESCGGPSLRAEKIAEMFNAAKVKCEAVTDLKKIRWEKLAWNIPFNGLCALTNLTPGHLLAHPPTRHLVKALITEVIDGGNAQQLSKPIPKEDFIENMLTRTEKMGDYRPSMMLDRQEGRSLELEALYEFPLREAAKRGKEMTQVRMLHALLDLGEQNR